VGVGGDGGGGGGSGTGDGGGDGDVRDPRRVLGAGTALIKQEWVYIATLLVLICFLSFVLWVAVHG
jgi:hypothetical protein